MDVTMVLKQLESAIIAGEQAAKRFPHTVYSAGNKDEPEEHQVITGAVTAISAAIRRLQPSDGEYLKQASVLIEKHGSMNTYVVPPLVGIAKALKRDVELGYLKSMGEQFHGEVFSDFLDMASHLLTQRFKDAAAVIAGGSLEGHLRKLCEKHGVTIVKASGDPKSLDGMNSELAKASVYGLAQQKAITAWADIRNSAAHGLYGKYDEPLVQGMIFGIRNFLAACPA